MNTAQLFGQRLRALRQAQGLSICALSRRAGFTATLAGMYERGDRNVSVENAATLARVLGADLGRMLTPDLPLGATLLDQCGNCQGIPPAGYRCLACGLHTSKGAA